MVLVSDQERANRFKESRLYDSFNVPTMKPRKAAIACVDTIEATHMHFDPPLVVVKHHGDQEHTYRDMALHSGQEVMPPESNSRFQNFRNTCVLV